MNNVIIELSPAEALVLFDLLSRFNENDNLEIEDRAETRVLWNMLSNLESILVAPFEEHFDGLWAQARTVVRDKGE